MSDKLRVLTVSFDDSTTFVAQSLSVITEHARERTLVCYHALISSKRNGDFVELHRDDPFFDFIVPQRSLYDASFLDNFDLVFFAKLPPGFQEFCARSGFLTRPRRPLLAVAFPGLEFSPGKGFANRLLCDVILFNTRHDRDVFESVYPEESEEKLLLVGNPTLVRRYVERPGLPAPAQAEGPTCFLAQNITPARLADRAKLIEDLLAACGEGGLVIKVRQRRGANAGHVHRELFSYESIATRERLQVGFTCGTMTDALADFDRFLSCSSTGVIEALAAGKTAAFVAHFNGWLSDGIHISGLSYATRYGIALSPSELPNLPRAHETFERDFGLGPTSDLCHLHEHVHGYRSSRPASSAAKARRPTVTDDVEIASAYTACGNPHKGLFLAMRAALSKGGAEAAIGAMEEALEHVGDGERIRARFVDPFLDRPERAVAYAHSEPAAPPPDSRPLLRALRGMPNLIWQVAGTGQGKHAPPTGSPLVRKLRKLRRDPVAFVRDARLVRAAITATENR